MEHDSQESGLRFVPLHRISQTSNSSLDLNQVLARGMDGVVKALKVERGFVALQDENGGWENRSARGIDKITITYPEEILRCVIEEVATSGEGVLISDAQMDARFGPRRSILKSRSLFFLCMPLKLKENILGMVCIDNWEIIKKAEACL